VLIRRLSAEGGEEIGRAAAREPRRQNHLSGRLPLRRLVELLKQCRRGSPSTCQRQDPIISLSATYQHDDPRLEEIKQGDAAIVGVGHCSTCRRRRHHSITLETRYGVPTVALHTDKFDKCAVRDKMAGCRRRGAPSCRNRSWQDAEELKPMSTQGSITGCP